MTALDGCQSRDDRAGAEPARIQILSLRPARRRRKNAESVDVICVFRLFLFLSVNEVLPQKVRLVLSNCCQKFSLSKII